MEDSAIFADTEHTATVGSINSGVRKRKRAIRPDKRSDKYKEKEPLSIGFKATCQHKGQKLQCKKFKVEDVLPLRQQFFKNNTKVQQDVFLTRFVAPYAPMRRTSQAADKKRQFSCTYYLKLKGKNVPVCADFFQKAFSIKKGRLRTIGKFLSEGKIPTENRGGDRRSGKSVHIKESVRKFIRSLPAQESHYDRKKSCRIYLSSELNMKKLWNLYNHSAPFELKVKRTMLTQIFLTEFNIGFASPLSDACCTCTLLQNRLKNEKDTAARSQIIVQKRIHKLRANAFYAHLKKDVPNSKTLCFDLQQVLPLPKTPIQEAFYSRQVSLYNFCVVNVDSRNPDFFCWYETQAGRGAEVIGTALLSHLTSLQFFNDTKLLRLFCDGCGGQNKNCHIIHTLAFWLRNKSPKSVKEIQIFYPVRGHSFLPADRAFGRLEKELKKKVVITTPEEYFTIFSKHGKVHKLYEDSKLFDIKGMESNYKKINGIQGLKRIIFKKIPAKRNVLCDVKIRCLRNYVFEVSEPFQTLLKRGKAHPKTLKEKSLVIILSREKKRDVTNLLVKQFGDKWDELEELKWFKEIILADEGVVIHEQEDNECECECLEPELEYDRV